MKKNTGNTPQVEGKFVDLLNERYYKIQNVDQMEPFFISVVSASDHWLFISSTGSLSAGRIRPENALFPYKSVDHIHESAENTGSKTIVRINSEYGVQLWEPFNPHHDGCFDVERNLYKNSVGDKIVFEEINTTLQLRYTYSWNTSEEFGFVRTSVIENLSQNVIELDILDGIQNILPSGAPLGALQTRSALVDAYKWNERDEDSALGLFTMYAKLSDRAEPAESLLATTVFNLDNDPSKVLLTSKQITAFRKGETLEAETLTKGLRGSYLINKSVRLDAQSSNSWIIVADIDKSHSDVANLQSLLTVPNDTKSQVLSSVESNQNELIGLMSGADAWQLTGEETTAVHHYANVLFNNMRGGVVENNYMVEKSDVIKTMTNANKTIVEKHSQLLNSLPSSLTHAELIAKAKESQDEQLVRLSYEYLPLTFGRRHGDPSRPWNHYEIKLKDEKGDRLLSYQGNWRDIFQNWEAMSLSYPEFLKSFIAKFVNASTVDGYNPYRITKDGIDWELLEPNDPWSNIGYWGDHQIIYLLKFLEWADKFEHDDFIALLNEESFSYANVPYLLCGVEELFDNPKDTVSFDDEKQETIEEKVKLLGSDGRLVLNADDSVLLVNLLEKILVPLLSKLSNLVLDGGIWLNTQRPEWNDANNAIVGNGLSMVTLYYMRRYVEFMEKMLKQVPEATVLSESVYVWMQKTTATLEVASEAISDNNVTPQLRMAVLKELSQIAVEYRESAYKINGLGEKTRVNVSEINQLLATAQTVLESSIKNNLREDGLFNAYNILTYSGDALEVELLYPMLEGQVSVLSSGYLTPEQSVSLLDKLFDSEMYREDQNSFMLYPDRDLASFMNKNVIPTSKVESNKLLSEMVEKDDRVIIQKGSNGQYYFNAALENSGFLTEAINQAKSSFTQYTESDWESISELYEEVFNHKAFTGRSGTMFGYEGLGSIYWHMVSKLLLAVQENYQVAFESDANSAVTKSLAEYYYRVREGIGFNKTAQNYGAFPTDPYSHTPKHAGAQQPGMTGQVKEEIITRFAELGLEIHNGALSILPSLLYKREFLAETVDFNYQNLHGENKSISVKAGQLAFTYCQVPFVYEKSSITDESVEITYVNGETEITGLALSNEVSKVLFSRNGQIEMIKVTLSEDRLL